ncbi:MAG TPA: pteridine-dependent deoxygenase [Rhodanobacteraceae bacterium]
MTQLHAVSPLAIPAAPRVAYAHTPLADVLADDDVLAVIGLGAQPLDETRDPRAIHVALPSLDGAPAPLECWRVDGPVTHGRAGAVGWARGGGWLMACVDVAETDHADGIGQAAEVAYAALCDFLAAQPDGRHVQRIWNYFDRINEGEGDAERYKHFCSGRLRGMRDFFDAGFPAATAIGLPVATDRLTIYCLATAQAGRRIENPRQLSAWRYPRRYGRTPPSFARAMSLPAGDALAISGTAAITGHESRHTDDLAAQLAEIHANLDALLQQAHLPAGFDAAAPLKAYIRHPADAPAVAAFFARHWPHAPHVLLQGDVCRGELLVEIDGWRYA